MATTSLDIGQWQARFAARRFEADRWAVNVQDLIERARTTSAQQIRDDYATYVFTVGEIAAHPGMFDPDLMSDYFTEFGRLAANLGEPANDRGVARALDQAITLQRQLGGEIAGLCLAKAAYLGSREMESDDRLNAIHNAVDGSILGSETWANAIIALAEYQIEVSYYDDAIVTVNRLRETLPTDLFDQKFRCAALVYEGVARFTSFQDVGRARQVLTEACTFEARSDDLAVARWVSTAYHYLARIAEIDRRFQEAVDLYLRGKDFHDRCPEEFGASAFIHLRIAEPLIAAGNLPAARDHLDEALRLVKTSSNISSARLQVQLGYATLKAANGDLGDAERIAIDALRSAQHTAFWRGELLCLGYLLVLGIRRRRIDKVMLVGFRILRTAIFGELRRNKLLKLLTRIPVILPIAVRRMSRRSTLANDPTRSTSVECRCLLHNTTAAMLPATQSR
jgi:tetratricopeptide (TPR) repeat protein